MQITPVHLKCHNLATMRVYETPNGDMYPSITTMLGGTESEEKKESLTKWQNALGTSTARAYTKKAADKGTNVHLMIEMFLKGEEISPKQFSIDDINVFTALKLKLKNVKVVAQEISLYSDRLGIAGRADCIGYYKGIPCVIDFKTSNKNKGDAQVLDYKLQITFYCLAVNEMYGTNIQQGVILMSSGTGFPLEFIFDIKDYVKLLEERVDLYYKKLANTL